MQSLVRLLLSERLANRQQLSQAAVGLLTGGGDLLTNLLAVAPIDERRLQETVAQALEMDVGPAGVLAEPSESLARLLPPAWASRLGVMPLSVDAKGCDIAVARRLDASSEKALRAQIRLPIRSYYVSQLRLREALADYCDLPLSPRLQEALAAVRARPVAGNERAEFSAEPDEAVVLTIPAPPKVAPAGSSAAELPASHGAIEDGGFEDATTLIPDAPDPTPLAIGPRGSKHVLEVTIEEVNRRGAGDTLPVPSERRQTVPASAEPEREALTVPAPPKKSSLPPTRSMLPRSMARQAESNVGESPPAQRRVAASISAPPELDVEELSGRRQAFEDELAAVKDTKALLACCYRFLQATFAKAAVWTVRAESFRLAHAQAEADESMDLVFGDGTVLLRAQQAREPVVQTMRPDQVAAAIAAALGMPEELVETQLPRVVCVPIVLRGRAVAMLVGSDARVDVHAAKIVALTALASTAAAEFTRLILERKRS